MTLGPTIAERWGEVRDRVGRAAVRSGRKPEEIRIVAVGKTHPAQVLREAYDAGARIFGENYVQEALPKIESMKDLPHCDWHFIGALQSNKAKQIVGKFSLIHSVDRISLAEALEKEARKVGQVVRILIEVNIGGEATKGGVRPDALRSLVEKISGFTPLEVKGLMSFPPPADAAESSRRFFAQTRELLEEMRSWNLPRVACQELSMGITDDFEVAIEEGATLVRIGTAIFGPRE